VLRPPLLPTLLLGDMSSVASIMVRRMRYSPSALRWSLKPVMVKTGQPGSECENSSLHWSRVSVRGGEADESVKESERWA
jgi:hypothetical protein